MSEALLPPDTTEGEAEGAGPQPIFLLDHSDPQGHPRDDLWRQGVRDLNNLDILPGFRWSPVGPAPLKTDQYRQTNGKGPFSGQVTDIAIVPDGTVDQHIYIATNDGGVWNTSDGGNTWFASMNNLPTLSMGALALDPTDPRIIYAGSGNPSDAGSQFSRGAGLYKSVDGGITWAVVDGGPFSTALSGLHIRRILALPNQVVLVATSAGLFRSVDGGLNFGANSPQYNDGRPLADLGAESITSLVADPQHAGTVFAAVSGKGIFVSADSGATFPAESNLFSEKHVGAPLKGTFSDIAFSVSAANVPNQNYRMFYASVQQNHRLVPTDPPPAYRGFFASRTEGQSWDPKPAVFTVIQPNGNNPTGGRDPKDSPYQSDMNFTIGVDPQDPLSVYIGLDRLWHTADGGNSFGPHPFTAQAADDRPDIFVDVIHWDQHALAFRPAANWPASPAPAQPTRFYLGTDGGISLYDQAVGHIPWKLLNGSGTGGIGTGLIYSLDFGRGSPANNQVIYAGLQDLGLSFFAPTLSPDWMMYYPGDGLAVAVDPADPLVAYGVSVDYFVHKTHDPIPAATQFLPGSCLYNESGPTPNAHIALEQNGADPNHRTMYVSVDKKLCKSADSGTTFTALRAFDSAVLALTTTALDSNIVWAGLADGSVHLSLDGGGSWDKGDFNSSPRSDPALPVRGIAVDPAKKERVAVAYAGFSSLNPFYPTGHVFLTEDNGQTWHDISGKEGQPDKNLPDLPLHCAAFVRGQGANPSTLLVGSDAGVLATADLGSTWKIMGVGIPRVLCRSLAVDNTANPPLVRVGTYGRSCYELKAAAGPSIEAHTSLAFDRVPLQKSASLPLQIVNAGGADLQITAINRADGSGDFSIPNPPAFPLTLTPGQKQTVTVQYQPSAADPARATFEILSNDTSASPYLLVASGQGFPGAATPRLAVDANLGFGTVKKHGTARTLTATLRNTGLDDLKIAGITRSDGSEDFTLTTPLAPNTVIHPGDSLPVTFSFTSSSNGIIQAKFDIASNDPRSPATIDLQGTGDGFLSIYWKIAIAALGLFATYEAVENGKDLYHKFVSII